MSITTAFDFSNPANYTLSNIQVSAGIASLTRDLPASPITQTSSFGTTSDYAYDNTLVEVNVIPNQLNLKDLRTAAFKASGTFYAPFSSTINGNYGGNISNLTGIATGAVSISGGKLVMTGGGVEYISYTATGIADFQQAGCIRFSLTPNYSGTPGITQIFVNIAQTSGGDSNLIQLRHNSGTGNISLYVFDQNASPIINNVSLGNWNPAAGTEYELELNLDITSGATRLFINGTQQGSTQAGTGTRSSSIGVFYIGRNNNLTLATPNFSVRRFVIFSAVQHTTTYAAPSALQSDNQYITVAQSVKFSGQSISLGAGALSSVSNLVDTFTAGYDGATTWSVSTDGGSTFQYWNGSTWAISSGSAQSNSAATINAHLSSLSLSSGSFELQAFLSSPSGLASVATTLASYQYVKFLYRTDGGTIQTNSSFSALDLLSLTDVSSASGGDTVKYAIMVGTQLKYWSGSAWANSDGSLSKTNPIATIQSNLSTLLSTNANIKLFVRLTSNDGSTTPTLTSFTVTYDFGGVNPTAPATCVVYGYIYDQSANPIVGATVTLQRIQSIQNQYTEACSHVILAPSITVTTDANGYFAVTVISDSQFGGVAPPLRVTFSGAGIIESNSKNGSAINIVVPDAASVNITGLISA